MMMLRLHFGDLSARHVASDPNGAGAVEDFTVAVAVLQRVEVVADLAVVAVGVDGFVLVEA